MKRKIFIKYARALLISTITVICIAIMTMLIMAIIKIGLWIYPYSTVGFWIYLGIVLILILSIFLYDNDRGLF